MKWMERGCWRYSILLVDFGVVLATEQRRFPYGGFLFCFFPASFYCNQCFVPWVLLSFIYYSRSYHYVFQLSGELLWYGCLLQSKVISCRRIMWTSNITLKLTTALLAMISHFIQGELAYIYYILTSLDWELIMWKNNFEDSGLDPSKAEKAWKNN